MYMETLDIELQKLCIPRGGSEHWCFTIPGKSGVSSIRGWHCWLLAPVSPSGSNENIGFNWFNWWKIGWKGRLYLAAFGNLNGHI